MAAILIGFFGAAMLMVGLGGIASLGAIFDGVCSVIGVVKARICWKSWVGMTAPVA